jgi:hypothetical protein
MPGGKKRGALNKDLYN